MASKLTAEDEEVIAEEMAALERANGDKELQKQSVSIDLPSAPTSQLEQPIQSRVGSEPQASEQEAREAVPA